MKTAQRAFRVCSLFALTGILSVSTSLAATRTWNNTGTDFNAAASWTGGAPATGDTVVFSTAEATQPNVSASISLAIVNFQAAGAGYDITSTNNTIKLTLTATAAGAATSAISAQNTAGTDTIDAPIVLGASSASTQTFNQSGNGGALVINGVISSTNSPLLSLNVTGNSSITLNGPNTYTGNTQLVGASLVVGGTVVAIGNDSAFSTGSVTLTNGMGFTAVNGTRNVGNAIIWGGSGFISGSNDLQFSGSFTSSGSNSRTMTVNNAGTTTLSGNVFLSESNANARNLSINGSGALNISGVITNNSGANTLGSSLTYNSTTGGTLTLTNANTYTGGTTLSSGTLVLGNKAAFGTGTVGWNGVSTSASTNLSGANAIANTSTFGANNTFTGTNNIELSGALSEGSSSRTTTNNMTGGAVLTYSGTLALSATATNTTHNFNGTGNTVVSAIISNGGASTNGITQSGTGSLTLSGPNTYSGKTTISNGTLSVASINSVSGGTANSNMGAPVTVANGTIDMGATTNTGALKYTGTGETTDRVINLAGSTGGATLDQSGTGNLKFTSNLTDPGLAATDERKTLTLQGSTAGTGEISGVISDAVAGNGGQLATSLTKAGTGTWTLSGASANTYTGLTTVNGGTLNAGAAGAMGATSNVIVNGGGTLLLSGSGNLNRVNDSAGISLAGGTFARAGTASEGTGVTIVNGSPTGGSNTTGLGALTLTATSSLDFGSSGVGTLAFASFTPGGNTLNILNYINTSANFATTTSGVDGTDDRLIFNQDQSGNLASFNFGGGFTAQEIALGGGYFEIIGVTAVPEASTWVMGALALSTLLYSQRRRFRRA